MSSQSAALRTTHGTVAGRVPATTTPIATPKHSDRISPAWLLPILAGGWLLLAYVVPAVGEWLAAVLDPTL